MSEPKQDTDESLWESMPSQNGPTPWIKHEELLKVQPWLSPEGLPEPEMMRPAPDPIKSATYTPPHETDYYNPTSDASDPMAPRDDP